MKQYQRCLAVSLILVLLLLTGCGETQMIPELNKPIESAIAYYTVSKSKLSKTILLEGSVVPEYENLMLSYQTNAYDIQVSLGDTVKKGDILFSQYEDIDKKILELEISLEKKDAAYQLDVKNQNKQIAEMKKMVSQLQSMGDYYNASLTKLNIQEMELNFDTQHAAAAEEIAKLQEKLAEYKEQKDNLNITAPCDGTIVASALTEEGITLEKDKTIVSIAKSGSRQLCSPYIAAEKYAGYQSVKAQIGDQTYDVSYVPYTDDELSYLEQTAGTYYSYFTVENLPDSVQCGDYAVFYLTKELEEPVIAVPKTALTKTASGYTVTVMEDGDEVIREVKLGSENLNMVEITEGLQEGEVLYVAKDLARYGVTYETVQPSTGDFSAEKKFSSAKRYAAKREPFINPVPGEITEIFISTFSEVYVKKGQQLYTVQPSIDKADWEQTKIDLKNFKEQTAKEKERREEEIKDKTKELKTIKNSLEKKLAVLRLDELKEDYEKFLKESEETLVKYEERVSNYELWSQGPYTVCAEKDGVISSFSAYKEGYELEENEQMCEFYDPTSFSITYEDSEKVLRYGMKLRFQSRMDGEMVEFPATVISAANVIPADMNASQAVICLDEDHYLECSNTGYLYVTLYEIKQVMTIPTTVIAYEESAQDTEGKKESDSDSKKDAEPEIADAAKTAYVWVYDANGCAVKRYISVMKAADGQAWISDGLSPDDVIVVH